MKKLSIGVIAGLLAVAAVFGTVAATKTTKLGATQKSTDAAQILARTKQLDRFEASLRKELAKKLPALPKLPKASAPHAVNVSAAAPARAAGSAPAAQRVIYRRPAPIVITKHRAGGEHEGGEHGGEGGGGGDD